MFQAIERWSNSDGSIMNRRKIPTAIQALAPCILVLCLAPLMSGCATKGLSPEETTLALVNGEPVTARDLEEGFESSHRGHTVMLAGAGAVREFLEKSIDRRLLVQEARHIGLESDPGIRQAVQTLVAQKARDQLYRDEVTRPQAIPDEAVQEAYQKMAQRSWVRHILTYTREDAERAIARVRGGEAFGAVAAEVSVSATAGKGGDLGLVAWGQLDPRLEGVVEGMQPGDLRGPIETEQGWNVLLLEEKRPWTERPELAKLTNRIKMTLSQRASSKRSFEFFDKLKRRWNVQVFEDALTQTNLLASRKVGPGDDQAGQITVAQAGDRSISLADLRARLKLDALQDLPSSYALQQVRRILDDAIFASLLEQEALRRGYDKRPTIEREARKLEEALLLDRLFGTVIYPRIQVTEGDARRFYDQNPKLFTDPDAVRLEMIALEGQQDAEAVLKEIQDGADFAALARQRSKDAITAQVGGELGWVIRGTTHPTFEAVAFSLKDGEVGIARTEKAYFVLRLEGRRAERLHPFADVKAKAQEMALKQRRREEVRRWVSRLREGSDIVIQDMAIRQAVAMYEEEAKAKAAQSSKGSEEKKESE
jgi:parvulin-like peptidyl-prolyl isomerase